MELAGLNEEQVQFLLNTVEEVERRRMDPCPANQQRLGNHTDVRLTGPEFASLAQSDNYENDLYFLAQLYDTNWKPT